MSEVMVPAGTIDESDIELISMTDDPHEAMEIIYRRSKEKYNYLQQYYGEETDFMRKLRSILKNHETHTHIRPSRW